MISPSQLQQRKQHVGASDVSALFGCGFQGKNAYSLWLEKTDKLEPEETSDEAMRGNYLESGIIDFAQDQIGETLERNVHVVCKVLPILHANLDAFAPSKPAPVEGKSAIRAEAWDDGSTAPEGVIIQTHSQLCCVESAELVYVPVLLPFLTLKMIEIPRNKDLCDIILEKVDAFWKCVKTDTPPEDSVPTLEILKRFKRRPGSVIEMTDEAYDAYVSRKAARKRAEEEWDEVDRKFRMLLGDAEAAQTPSGRLVTYYEQQQLRIDVAGLRKNEPAIAEHYNKPVKFRKMMFPKVKNKK